MANYKSKRTRTRARGKCFHCKTSSRTKKIIGKYLKYRSPTVFQKKKGKLIRIRAKIKESRPRSKLM